MEDFVVLSVLDIELDSQITNDKSKISYHVMLGDECVDSLLLGSAFAQTQQN